MRFLLLIIPAIILVYLIGGNLKWLINRPLNHKWLVMTALFIQIVIFSGFPFINHLPALYIGIVHIVSYLLLLSFIALNISVPGIALLGTGTLLNTIVIAANGGFMPSPLLSPGSISKNVVGLSSDSRLIFLADVLSVPEWFPLPEAFSIGDVFIALGMVAYLLINSRKPKSESAV